MTPGRAASSCAFACAVAVLALAAAGASSQSGPPLRDARQLLLVVTDGWESVSGTLQRFERSTTTDAWRPVGPTVAVVVGRKGLAWGRGEPAAPPSGPASGPVKTEGDAKAPAGAFRLGTAFGQSAQAPAGLRLPYLFLADNVECVDDSRSRYYNRLLARTSAADPDWTSSEKMWAEPLYRWGIVVEHNTQPVQPLGGSCIFLHIWSGPTKGTAGCTAMDETALAALLQWLDPAKHPMLVQLPRHERGRLGSQWGLPPARQAPDVSASIVKSIDAQQDRYSAIAKVIWDYAELGFQEAKSSALLQKTLADAGFSIEAGVAGMPTAFTASYGTGKPVVAIVGEFDALPGLSQAAGEPARRPLVSGAPGHACGHNLLGTASAAAAIAVKEWMAQTRQPGTVRYYGTPAEEGGGGKVFMVRDGLLRDVDVVLGWHPGDRNAAQPSSSLATIAGTFRFYGTAAHAAAAPDKGRSALDGLEALDYMVNMMREHVPQETRIHYVIKKGGVASNIVPDYAEAEYQARHPDMRTLQGIWDRILKAAEGAAMGTGTRFEHEIVMSYWNVLPNETLAAVAHRNLSKVGGVDYAPGEQAFAEKIRATLVDAQTPMGVQKEIEPIKVGLVGSASTDLGDISWNVPTAHVTAATFVPGVTAHTWQATACTGMSIGFKGMMVAAKALALTASDLFRDPATIARAKQEFLEKRGGADFRYSSLVGDRKPPLDYRKEP